MNIDLAKKNMIQRQLWEEFVLDEQLLETFQTIPREFFVPQEFEECAFADMHLPIGHGQIMMRPNEQGQLLQALEIKSTNHILEIGTGTGYLTSLLAKLGHHIDSVDIFPDFIETAKKKLKKIDISNANLKTYDATKGFPKARKYDVILITASVKSIPKIYLQNLKPGGHLFVILDRSPLMSAELIKKDLEGNLKHHPLFNTVVPQLINAPQSDDFQL